MNRKIEIPGGRRTDPGMHCVTCIHVRDLSPSLSVAHSHKRTHTHTSSSGPLLSDALHATKRALCTLATVADPWNCILELPLCTLLKQFNWLEQKGYMWQNHILYLFFIISNILSALNLNFGSQDHSFLSVTHIPFLLRKICHIEQGFIVNSISAKISHIPFLFSLV